MVSGRVLPCNNDSAFGQGGQPIGGHRNEIMAREEHKGVALLFCFLLSLSLFFFKKNSLSVTLTLSISPPSTLIVSQKASHLVRAWVVKAWIRRELNCSQMATGRLSGMWRASFFFHCQAYIYFGRASSRRACPTYLMAKSIK